MRLFTDLDSLPAFKNAVMTIGSYDGVHRGHQRILARMKQIAKEINGETIVVTFDPHPRQILQPDNDSLRLLSLTNEKSKLLAHFGIDNVVVVPFSKAFSEMAAEDYVRQFLIESFEPHTIVIGYDHRYGHGRSGGIELLRDMQAELKYQVEEISAQEVNEIKVSSTKVRNALFESRVREAAELLGHPFSLRGEVVHGQKIGAKIGYPTANLEVTNGVKLIPADGIYAVRVTHQDQQLGGMLYIGNRPTLNGVTRTIEVNIFDYQAALYGDVLILDFIKHIREDVRFDSLEALQAQLALDEAASRAALAEELPQYLHAI